VIITDFNGGMPITNIPVGVWADRFVMRQKANPVALEQGNEIYEGVWGPNQTGEAAAKAYIERCKATREAMDGAYGRGHYAPLLACCQGDEKIGFTEMLVRLAGGKAGFAAIFDGAVVHCYPKESQSESTGKELSFHRAGEVHGVTGLPVWITEFGAENPGKFSEPGAAAALKEFVEKCRASSYVAGCSNYAYEERGERFGLVNNSMAHKPGYAALHSVA
jgi:hypothetical protein